METHGSESYFVIGEGLLSESMNGREPVLATAAAAGAPPFRFTRMGPRGTALGEANRKKIANAMTVGGGGPSDIPAGYTYLGQFVDHDLTFDKTNVTLGQNVSPAELLQARSPSLDLDSLYGAGPSDPGSAKFYKDDRHLKMGKTVAIGPDPAHDGHDLPRGAGTTQAQKRRAIIPDRRNDENLAVAQTHLAFIRFHNRIVDTLPLLGARRAALRDGARARGQALPVDAPPRLPAAHLRAVRGRRRVRERPQGVRGRGEPDSTCRRCRSSSRSPASGSGTA